MPGSPSWKWARPPTNRRRCLAPPGRSKKKKPSFWNLSQKSWRSRPKIQLLRKVHSYQCSGAGSLGSVSFWASRIRIRTKMSRIWNTDSYHSFVRNNRTLGIIFCWKLCLCAFAFYNNKQIYRNIIAGVSPSATTNLKKQLSRGFSFLISMLNREDSRYGSYPVHSQQQENVTRAVWDSRTVNTDSAQTPTESSRTRGAAAEESQVVWEISVTFYSIYWAVIFTAH